MTNANRHENSTFGQIRLTENDIAIFDRGYFNKRQFQELTESSISFVTRNKSNIEY
ncbi:MAG: transposase [Treponema sp.]|nr:transposase [Treponema sp.]